MKSLLFLLCSAGSFGVPWLQNIAIYNFLKLGHLFRRLYCCCAVLGKDVYILRYTDVAFVTLYTPGVFFTTESEVLH